MRVRVWQTMAVAALGLSFQIAQAQVPCEADVARLCKDVPMGGGRIQACLKAHEAEVSPACRERVDALAGEVKLLTAVCRWDIGRLCSDTAPGSGRLMACLERNTGELSPECGKQLADMKNQP